MNLMFWKKKTGAGEEAENAREYLAASTKLRESLDFSATKQGIAERNPESPEPKTPAKPGLAAWMKLRLTALTRHFKKAPTFHADEVHAPDALGDSERSDAAASIEPDLESPSRPRLAVRIKLQFITLVRRFRKTPALDVVEKHAVEAGESPRSDATAKPGLLMRIKAGFVAFIREIKAPTAPTTSEEDEAVSHGHSMDSDNVGETAAEPARPRKWLIVGGSVFIVTLLLIDIAMNLWLTYEPPQKRWGTRHDATSISSRPSKSESSPEEPRNEIEALQKKNAELQTRIEALKKELPQQQPYAPPAWQNSGGGTPSSSVSGEMMVGNKDPQATAMTLKEAIEAMNASSGEHAKKPAK